ncbi:hypothetical protein [Halobacillus ihumii]|uniref:hypothetical protein n=1 Tax=Halobacillus ihumii TaxID=2686092 RepID=UPI0013D03393|nr:hypothetical protein [Halobacillus ihumii]
MNEKIIELVKDKKVAVIRGEDVEIRTYNRLTDNVDFVHLTKQEFETIAEAMKGGE